MNLIFDLYVHAELDPISTWMVSDRRVTIFFHHHDKSLRMYTFKEKMWVTPVFRELGYHSAYSLSGQRFKALNLCISVTNWDMDVKQKAVLRLCFFATFWNDFWVKFCIFFQCENENFEIVSGIGWIMNA